MGEQEPNIAFRGNGRVRVRDFLNRMKCWFTTMGEEYNGKTTESKSMRAAQIQIACPVDSTAGDFLRQLPDSVLWDDEALMQALIEHFDDTEMDGQSEDDILSIMNGIEQGKRDVFSYSRKVLKLLRKKPANLQQYDKILIRYYIDGLASHSLRKFAVVNFLKTNSHENPYEVVRSVMRWARELKMKGYKQNLSRGDSYDESTGDDEQSSGDESSDSDSDSDSDDDEVYKCSKKSSKKLKKRAKRKREKKPKNKSKGKKVDRGEEFLFERIAKLGEKIEGLLKVQPASQDRVAAHPEKDIIPLENYAVNRNYRNHLQQARYDYAQFNQGQPSHYQPQYPNRRSQYYYPEPHYASPYIQPIDRPNSALEYPTRNSLVCYTCQEEGHIDSQCPKLRLNDPQSTLMEFRRVDPTPNTLVCYLCGGQHLRPHCPKSSPYGQRPIVREDRCPSPYRAEDLIPPPPSPPPARRLDQAVNVVEIATELSESAFNGVKVTEDVEREIEEKSVRRFVEKISESDDESDGIFPDRKESMMVYEEEGEEIIDDEFDDYYPGQVFENPEN